MGFNPVDWANQLRVQNPQEGQTTGNRVYSQGQWQDIGNPNDPSQLRNWGLGVSKQNQNLGLFDNMDYIKNLLSPLYAQQQNTYTGKFNNLLNSQVGQAQNQAGAMAAFRGQNPGSATYSAGQGVRSQLTPQYMTGLQDLLNNQMGTTLDTTAKANQFKAGNAQSYASALMNGSNQASQTWDQPGFFDYLFGGLTGSLGSLGGAAINKWG